MLDRINREPSEGLAKGVIKQDILIGYAYLPAHAGDMNLQGM
jgi:hypothetical protein